MRTLMIISLASAVACQETETEIGTDDNSSTAGTVEEGNQEDSAASQDWQVRDDFAGGTIDTSDSLFFFDEISGGEDGDEQGSMDDWGAAPMVEGIYMGTVEMVVENVCGELEPGLTWETRLRVSESGSSLLGGGLLESNGDQLRFNRIKETPVEGSMDCVEVEYIQGVGSMYNATEMDFEFETSVFLEGTDCPVSSPCTDRYMAYVELNDPTQ